MPLDTLAGLWRALVAAWCAVGLGFLVVLITGRIELALEARFARPRTLQVVHTAGFVGALVVVVALAARWIR